MSASRYVLVAVSDLFFLAKIQTTATHAGVELATTTAARLVDDCRRRRPDRVIVDLHAPGGVLDAVRDLRRDTALASIPVLGFYSHVDDATRRAALEAGVDEAMPRSAFTVRLAALLRGD
jgi:DNA-binding NarL/FixJ family response regulator